MEQKIFLIINLSYFGDVLLTNTLCQNIKLTEPNSKIIFLVNSPYVEAAKYQYQVDEVLAFDKRGKNKGLTGILNFVRTCKYKNKIDCAFIIYGNARGILISYFLGCKKRISTSTPFVKYLLTDIYDNNTCLTRMQDINGDFIRTLTNKEANILPIKYQVSSDNDCLSKQICKSMYGKNLIALCTVSKDKSKDMPLQTAKDIIDYFNRNHNNRVVFLGQGKEVREYADNLKKLGCVDFIDLTNITSIKELACILKLCSGLISIDTGTMHLSYALDIPTVCVFYKKDMVDKWSPDSTLYKTITIKDNQSADNICKAFENIIN